MNHKFMKRLAKELGERGIGTLRFNFAFMEHKKGRPDPAPVAEKTIEAVVSYASKSFPTVPLFAGGKSFGGRMTSGLLSKKPLAVKGIIFYGFPLHPPGKPSTERATHLTTIAVPMLFLQGTRDALANVDLINGVTAKLPTAKIKMFDRADHSFAIGKTDVLDQLVSETHQWIHALLDHKL
jgi:uncharacterized protein